MRFLFLILALYCGSAEAQYTTKSTNKAPTTYQQPAQQVAVPQPTTAPAYTTQGAQPTAPAVVQQQPTAMKSYTTQKKVTAQPQAGTQPTSFRPTSPRPTQASADGEDDLPSFEAFKQKKQSQNAMVVAKPTAQGANGVAGQQPRPLIIPKGEIWVARSGFEDHEIYDHVKSCAWKLAIQNRTDTTIDRIRIEYKVGSDSNTYIISGLKPGDYLRKNNDSEGPCPSMGIRPTLKILSCKFADVTGNKCAEYFVLK